MSQELAKNKKAYHDYEILDTLEVGIILTGPEVKSCRIKKVQLKGSYVSFESGKPLIKSSHISPYKNDSNKDKFDPERYREILMHKKEALKLEHKLNEQGISIVPLKLYLKKGLIKASIGICKGKQLHDKRRDLKKKEQNLEIKRALKKYK
ncbi:SsrA-binding protein SmpB [Patescibacteria group bacterium]|nr:SsrA-binding protein SmpB [Patescibacteria group bacterium]